MFAIASQRHSIVTSRLAQLSVAVVVTVGLGTSAGSGIAEAHAHSARSLDQRTAATSHVKGHHSPREAGKATHRAAAKAKASGRKIG